MNRKIFLLLILISSSTLLVAQQPVITNISATNAINNVLVGGGVQTSNIVFNGVPQQLGFFTNGQSFGIDTGIVLSSGNVGNIAGLATATASTNMQSTNSDADILLSLQQNSALSTSANDVASLEFDFTPMGDTIIFDYVFGSEEYPEFVCNFNDGFAMFLSGPGINGGFSNGAINLAKVPGTNTPVSISTVNLSSENCAQANSNSNFYVNNLGVGGSSIVFDGYTKVFKARYHVQCGQTYHLKIIIADCNDRIYDSGVFLKARSLKTSSADYKISAQNTPTNSLFYESCGTSQFIISRPPPYTQAVTLPLVFSGTATVGTDYNTPPSTVTFAAGQQSAIVQIIAINDVIAENPESITLSVASLVCPNLNISSTIYLYDYQHLTANTGPDTVKMCIGKQLFYFQQITGGSPSSYSWSTGAVSPTLTFTTTAANTNMWYYITMKSICDIDTIKDSVYVQGLPSNDAKIRVTKNVLYEACPVMDTLVITLEVGVVSPITYPITISGTAINNVDYSFIDTVVNFVPGVLIYYVPFQLLPDGLNNETIENITITISPKPNMCVCSQEDSKSVNIIDSTQVKVVLNSIQLKCPGESVLLKPNYQSTNGTLFWNTFNSYNQNYNFTSTNTDTTQVVISIVDTICGVPTIDVDTAFIYPSLYQQLNIIEPQSLVLKCLNDTFNFNAVLVGGISHFSYSWYNDNNTLLDTLNNLTQVISQNSNYHLVVKDGCNKKDTLNFSITQEPRPDFVLNSTESFTANCPDELISINVIASGGLLPYQYSWNTGETTPTYQTNINTKTVLILTAKDSCNNERRKIITLNPAIYTKPSLTITADTAICPGQTSILSAKASDGYSGFQYTFSTIATNSFVLNDVNTIEATLNTSSYYTVTCVDGCENSVTDSIFINKYVDCNARIKNVIAVDGSVGNKALYIEHIDEYPNTHVIIYNRWGIKVYENFNFTNESSWTATEVDAGTFYYIVEFDSQLMADNNKRTGFIQVLK